MLLLCPAAAAAQPPPDVPVAACPEGAGSATLRVAHGATGDLAARPVRRPARPREKLSVAADGRTLWASPRGGFVAAGAGDPGITDGGGGFYRVRASFTDCWRRQSVTAATRSGSAR